MKSQTIRRNAHKTIRSILEQCALVTCYKYDDMDTNTQKGALTVDDVMGAGEARKFDRVYAEVGDSGEWCKITVSIHQNWFFTGYRTKQDAKQFMTHDAWASYYPEDAAAEREAAEQAHAALMAQARIEDARRIEQLTTESAQGRFFVGQRIIAKFAALNKNSTLGLYIRECEKPEDGKRYWTRSNWHVPKNWYMTECKVHKVIRMTTAEYDHFAVNVMDSMPELFDGFGGAESDYKLGRDVENFWDMTQEEQALWSASSYSVVAVIEAPRRQTIVVNPEGYSYARYVGLSPKPMQPDAEAVEAEAMAATQPGNSTVH